MQVLGVFPGVCCLRGLLIVGAAGRLGAAPVGHVNPDKPDNCGQIPDSHAIHHGHKEAVKTLCGPEDVDPDKPDNCSKILLSYAAITKHEELAKLYYLGRKMSIPTCQVTTAKHRSWVPPRVDIGECLE